ncbi:hypothetical protein XENOCAPTIV_024180 [Xenoophorus captivus]|uniref:Dystrophin n=1 Tax=Xenoophorus captivus TaxID=1517983 RepID=A0ABV0QBW2_9TELE
MMESLERIAERLRQPPSISVEVDKIKEQITENKAVSVDLEKLQPAYETLKHRGEEMIARSEGANKDISAKGIECAVSLSLFIACSFLLSALFLCINIMKAVQDKLDHMVFLWNDIQALLEEREAKLLDVMDLADKFWCDHCALIATIKDSQDLLRELEEPGVDPSVNSAWENLNKTWKERVERLEEAMQAAEFKGEAYQLQIEMERLNHRAGLLLKKVTEEADCCAIKEPMSELKMLWDNLDEKIISRQELCSTFEAKGELYQELLDKGGQLLAMTPEGPDINTEQDLASLKEKWEAVQAKVAERKVGNQCMAFTALSRNDSPPLVPGREHIIELDKTGTHLKYFSQKQDVVLIKNLLLSVQGRWEKLVQRSVERGRLLDDARKRAKQALKRSARELVENSHDDSSWVKVQMQDLSTRWDTVCNLSVSKQARLEQALCQAEEFHTTVHILLEWLAEAEQMNQTCGYHRLDSQIS